MCVINVCACVCICVRECVLVCSVLAELHTIEDRLVLREWKM